MGWAKQERLPKDLGVVFSAGGRRVRRAGGAEAVRPGKRRRRVEALEKEK